MELQIPKGTFDILPYGTDEAWRLSDLWQYVESVIRKIASEYGYREIRTPIYERTDLFDRGVGETSDIVMKEMFTFEDKGGRSMSLRPEGTSSVMRSFIENRLANLGTVHKFFYIGPMFRYERPQSGRYRQHQQFGVEAIGVAGPEQDAEVIDILCHLYKTLGLKNLKVHINTVGDPASRNEFRNALREYLKPHLQELSPESQARFEKNPLRILDSKDPKDRELIQGAPSILNHLTPEARHHFQELCRLLDLIQVPYVIDDKIVRGLDYYNKTVFEVLTEDLGAQNTLGGGGRYDGLISTFGGPDLPGVGFATGLERVLQVMIAQKISFPKQGRPFVYFIPLGEEAKEKCFALATLCRHNHIGAEIELHAKKMQTALQNAARSEALYCAIIGTDELQKGLVQLKHLERREQREIHFDHLLTTLKELAHV
ncbi:MAG TPA: histidine--tRNA ligase [Chlamydiales bacterium]|nr:histidine--tRNA ligase [Chlamydiales bacterium]